MKPATKRTAYGTTEIARMCQVSPPTVVRWIQEGKLPFFTTGGGHRRVKAGDLVAFLKAHNIPIPSGLEAAARFSVLIVDDEDDMRALIRHTVAALAPSAEIHEAADGFEAGQKLSAVLPSVVVLDVWLPGVNGVKVCGMIRSDENLRATKILAISGRDVDENRRACLDAGADDFLSKPFEVKELKRHLLQLMSGDAVEARQR